MHEVIRKHAAERPNDAAIVARDGVRTWSQLQAEIERYEHELRELALTSPVGVLLPTEGSAIALLAACASANIDVLLLSPEQFAI